MDAIRGRCQRSPCRYYHAPNALPDHHASADLDPLPALPAGSVMPYKRAAAADKSGLPVYQPVQQQQMPQQATYHQILQMQQPNIVPVSYGSAQPLAIPRYQ